MTENTTIERTYYYDLGEHGIEPDHESMAAFLLDKGIVYLSAMWDAKNNEGAYKCFQNQWEIMLNALKELADFDYNKIAIDALNAVDKEWDRLYSKE